MFKELYDKELHQRETLRSAVGTPIGLLTVFGGLLGAMSQSVWFENSLACYLFLLFGGTACLSLLSAVVFLIRSYHGHEYKTLPTAKELAKYKVKLKDWYRQYGGGNDDYEVEFEESLNNMYILGADHNAFQNTQKSEYLYRANGKIILCGVFVLLTFLPYSVHRRSMAQAVQKVELVGFKTPTNDNMVNKIEIVSIPEILLKEAIQVTSDPKAAPNMNPGGNTPPTPPKPAPPAMQTIRLNVDSKPLPNPAQAPPKPTPPPMQTTREGKVPSGK